MVHNEGLVNSVNMVFCLIIFIFGNWANSRSKERLSFFVGIAFLLFGVANFLNIIGLAFSAFNLLIIIRIIAYLVIIFSLYRIATRS